MIFFSFVIMQKWLSFIFELKKLIPFVRSYQNKIGDISDWDFVIFVNREDNRFDLIVGTDGPHKESALEQKYWITTPNWKSRFNTSGMWHSESNWRI